MRNFDLRELQLSELTILEELERICKKHNLTYFLAWGSALGAKRHQGFIPWDDDIDVSMPWSDYWKFREICKKELSKDFYYQDHFTDSDYFVYWAKLRKNNTTSMTRAEKELNMHWGICIDIFPLLPLKEEKIPARVKLANTLLTFLCNKSFVYCKGYEMTNAKRIKKMIYACIPNSCMKPLEIWCFKQFGKDVNQANFYVDISAGNHTKVFDVKSYGKGRLMKFENKDYTVPENVEEYLSAVYGSNYMEIPKQHERVDHGDIIVDLEKDYSHYQ